VSAGAHPAFDVLAPWLRGGDLPDAAELDAIAERLPLRPFVEGGNDVRFVAATGPRQKAVEYEQSIHDTGRVPIRANDWHDAFNALCWIAWPVLKAQLNRMHVMHGTQAAAERGAIRDTLTLLDESGVIVLSSDPALAALLPERRWKSLFFERRDDVMRSMRFLVCGHALLDKLRSPYRSIAGRALIVAAPQAIIDEGIETQRRFADAMAAAIVLQHCDEPPPTTAFPLCGVPGWWPGNEAAAFYDDASIFRTAASPRDPPIVRTGA
jgi:hypothetical protein